MSNRTAAGQREAPGACPQVERALRTWPRPKTALPAGLETGAASPPQHGALRERPCRSEIGWHHEAYKPLSSQSRDESVFLFLKGEFRRFGGEIPLQKMEGNGGAPSRRALHTTNDFSSPPHPSRLHRATFPYPLCRFATSSLPLLAFGHFPLTGGIGPLTRGVGPQGEGLLGGQAEKM